MNPAIPPADWGPRLSDRIRAALDAGDLDRARRLALEGDGQARSLAGEYTLMLRGLGITLRILLDLLGETLARADGETRKAAAPALLDLLGGFRLTTGALLHRTFPDVWLATVAEEPSAAAEPSPSATGGSAEAELALTARLLSEAEALGLREQAARAEEAIGAMEAGDGARARALVDRKERDEWVPLHDALIRLMADAFAWVLTAFGRDELYRVHRAMAERQRPGFEKWERLDPAPLAQAAAFLLKQHMGRVEVREDQEKFTIVQTPCGSGGRLRLAGAYAGPRPLPFVEGGGPLTAGQERLPVYCSHCPIWNSVAPVEWFGRAQWVFDDPARPDGSCTLAIYKRRDAVPAAYYRSLGLAAAPR